MWVMAIHDSGERKAQMLHSLDGLSVGDAFGELFFIEPRTAVEHILRRRIPDAPWRWTDDTEMALSIVSELSARGTIDQDKLAHAFAARLDRARGYGGGAIRILSAVASGTPWRSAAASVFDGSGSYGNGAAMRAAPIGALFSDDLERCAAEARASSEVTHAHPEGIAGGVAVACAAALMSAHRAAPLAPEPFLTAVAEMLPATATRDGIEQARALTDLSALEVAERLGSGSRISAQDTVPFCLWVACRYPDDFEEALWQTVAALGDRDTTCAIVGGIIASGGARIPAPWLEKREPLPALT